MMVFPVVPGLLSLLRPSESAFLLTSARLLLPGPQDSGMQGSGWPKSLSAAPEMDGGGCPVWRRRRSELCPAANSGLQPGHPAGCEEQAAFQVENSRKYVGIHLGSLGIF